uniref:Uncharacterized protein n=1 Tax=Anas platyrhynchos TaxID=8839 RepID=A0A8B9T4C4_ANAPL
MLGGQLCCSSARPPEQPFSAQLLFPLGHGQKGLSQRSALWEAWTAAQAEWRSGTAAPGGRCVTMPGTCGTPRWRAGSWAVAPHSMPWARLLAGGRSCLCRTAGPSQGTALPASIRQMRLCIAQVSRVVCPASNLSLAAPAVFLPLQIPHGAVQPPAARDSQCLSSSASSWGPSSACSWPSWLGRCEAPGLGAEVGPSPVVLGGRCLWQAGGAGGVGVLGHRNRAVCCLLPHVLPH